MPESGFVTPELQDVVDRVSGDVDSNLPGASSRLRRRQTRAVAVANAGAAYLLHLLARDISIEGLPDCGSETAVLRWADLYGIQRNPAVKASGTDVLRFTGANGEIVPSGTIVVRDDGVELITTEAGTISGGQIDVDAEAVEAGADGNTAAGVVAQIASPLPSIDSAVTVVSPGLTDGLDLETIESLRGRILDRLQQPPQGGSFADYVQWTKEAVSNVRTVWVGAEEPVPGHVTIRFIVEPPDGDPNNALPSAGQVQAAQDYIGGTAAEDFEDAAAPVPTIGDRIDVRTITGQTVTMEITNLNPDTTEIRAAVVAALQSMFLTRGRADGGTLELSQFYGAIDAVPGEISHEITLINGIAPAAVTTAVDSFPVIDAGDITFV